ncbi:tRNA lysidine(34) synthetase TilS [Spiribacter sp. 221]|uniref:tRNA lysidine(34) synthetase TilS n=1 Tax=Spiribacter onubensis TaxID=3122420 RepID=UPI00349F9139
MPRDALGCVIAFSGGLDSTALLHLATKADRPVRAIHIHHGLQAEADSWARHCSKVCRALGVPLTVVRVNPAANGRGLEDAAREARYAALAARLEPGECLLTAHHADDQLETLLLRMMRGTGPDGLAGIPARRPFGAGWLVRPLLEFPRERLHAYAQANALRWIDDPANADPAQDRNYLRHQVIPLLTARWPGATEAGSRLAGHSWQQRNVMQMLLADHRRRWPGPSHGPLPLQALWQSDSSVRPALLREWLRNGGWVAPGTSRLERGLEMLLDAGADRQPAMVWGNRQVRRHGGWLYRLPWPLPPVPDPVPADALGESGRDGLADFVFDGEPSPGLWCRAPRPGERLSMPRRPAKPLKELLREAGIVPWWRPRLPLLEDGDGEVLAVAGLGLTTAGQAAWGAGCGAPCCTPRRRADGPDWAWLTPPC